MTRDLALISPMLVLSLGSFMLLLIEVCARAGGTLAATARSRARFTAVTLLLTGAALWCNRLGYVAEATVFGGVFAVDGVTWFLSALIVVGALLAVMLGSSSLPEEGIEAPSEFYSLYLMSTAGAILFCGAAELITLFVGLEIMSMALYCLCGASIGGSGAARRRSAESAMKYFLLGSFSSAFLLYGIALLYGLTGTTVIADIASASPTLDSTMLFLSIGLMLVGLAFKVGAVPFHFWAPDVYQGAPTTITAYMACVIKAAAVGAMLRVFWSGFHEEIIFWSGAVWVIAALTMTVGNLIALRQRSMKRMLAYSSIAHAGYLLTAFLAPGDQFGGGAAILYYLVAYSVMTLGAFGVVVLRTARHSDESLPDDITRFNGLGWRKPALGALMALFMLSLAGIPPGMAGLLGKFYLFSAVVKADYIGLVVIGVLNSAISCYYYLRVIVAMYFVEPEDEQERDLPITLAAGSALGVCALAVIALGVFPAKLQGIAAALFSL